MDQALRQLRQTIERYQDEKRKGPDGGPGVSIAFFQMLYQVLLGQELVARIDSRGRVNRHLRGIVVTRNVLPPEGAEFWLDDRMCGTLTSVSESLGVMAPIALCLLRREVESGDDVEVRWEGGATPAIARELPLV